MKNQLCLYYYYKYVCECIVHYLTSFLHKHLQSSIIQSHTYFTFNVTVMERWLVYLTLGTTPLSPDRHWLRFQLHGFHRLAVVWCNSFIY